METDSLKISEVLFKSNNVPPLIVYFENGALKYKPHSQPECGVYRDKDAPEKYVAAVCTKDNLLYMGSELGEEPLRTVLAVHIKGTNKVKLIEVEKVLLKPKPLGASMTQTLPGKTPSTYSDLFKHFGSKQTKRRSEQRERMSFNIQSFESRLNETITDIKLDESINVVDNVDFYGTYLKCNRDATHAKDVYNLADIITNEELNELYDEAIAVLENTPEENAENYSEFFNENLKELPDHNKVFRAQILLYAECIVQFLNLGNTEIQRKNTVVCPLSNVINKKLFDLFTETSEKGRNVSVSLKNKSLFHAIVAGLLACNFTLIVASLPEKVEMPLHKLQKLCRCLGAQKLRKEEKFTIHLKVPLPLVSKQNFSKKRR